MFILMSWGSWGVGVLKATPGAPRPPSASPLPFPPALASPASSFRGTGAT